VKRFKIRSGVSEFWSFDVQQHEQESSGSVEDDLFGL